jgi:hypothetical protein
LGRHHPLALPPLTTTRSQAARKTAAVRAEGAIARGLRRLLGARQLVGQYDFQQGQSLFRVDARLSRFADAHPEVRAVAARAEGGTFDHVVELFYVGRNVTRIFFAHEKM